MTINADSSQIHTHPGALTTMTYGDLEITSSLVRQLDQVDTLDWEQFEPIGRTRCGLTYNDSVLELVGIHTPTGALVRMAHRTAVVRTVSAPDPHRDLRESLTMTYLELPLIVLGD